MVGLPSYMTEPHLEIGAAFPDSPVRLWIAAYAKLAPDGAQTSNAVVASAVRIAKALQGHTADNVGVSLLSFQYEDYKKLSPSRTPCIIFVMPPHPGGG